MNPTPNLQVQLAQTSAAINAIRQLLWTYGEARNFDAAMGNYKEELAQLPGKYGPPEGALLLAKWQGQPAGCVAIRQLSSEICEMKRMYVHPDFRQRGIGKALIETILEHARLLGYTIMRLDSHPHMIAAQSLYEKAGFYPIDAYNDNPTPGIRFFECLL